VTARSVLSRRWFARPAPEVVRDLLGAVLVSRIGGERVTARIVETEAYLGRDDPASHAWCGRRHAQNEGLYGPPGFWYVYLSYGVHWCANLVCGPRGLGAAVLLRGIEPIEGVAVAHRRRGRVEDRCDGPGKLTQALGMTRAIDQVAMPDSVVVVCRGSRVDPAQVWVTPRIGITRAVDWPLRFLLARRAGRRTPGRR
jgi:DNA-3-methyladenine glycosylase